MSVILDVYSGRPGINFKNARVIGTGEPVEGIIPRCAYGNIVDSEFWSHIAEAKKAGIAIPGIYLAAYPLDRDDVIAEANLAVHLASKMDYKPIIFYDYEYFSRDYAKKKGVNVTAAMINEWTDLFCSIVSEKGFKAGIYFNIDYRNNIYSSSVMNKYVKWLADWTGQPDYECDLVQFTSVGRISGYNNTLDMNRRLTDRIRMNYTVNSNKKQVTDEIVSAVINGDYGNGTERYNKLVAEGYDYYAVQEAVTKKLEKPYEINYDKVVQDILNDKYGVNPVRRKALIANGIDPDKAQELVNQYLKDHNKPEITDKLVSDVIDGKYGNGQARRDALSKLGYNYDDVMAVVNTKLVSPEEIARKVIRGDYGNNPERADRLTAEGYDPAQIQEIVNRLI